jgi:hypothetical protein
VDRGNEGKKPIMSFTVVFVITATKPTVPEPETLYAPTIKKAMAHRKRLEARGWAVTITGKTVTS